MHPSRRGGHPYGLKDAAKWHEGCTHPAIADTHRASWPWASRHLDVPFGPEACGHAACWTPASRHTEVPFRQLRTPHGPSWSQGNDEKDASLGGKARGHRAASTPASEGNARRFADSREACALIDVPMSRRAPAIDEEGYWISSSTASDASPFAPCGAVGSGGLRTMSLALLAVRATEATLWPRLSERAGGS